MFEHGCAGVVDRCEETPQGRYNILLRGVVRFRVLEEHAGEPYRLATVEPLPDLPGEPAELAELRRRVLAAVGSAADGPSLLVQDEVPDDLFVNVLSQSLPLRPLERQSLLVCGLSARVGELWIPASRGRTRRGAPGIPSSDRRTEACDHRDLPGLWTRNCRTTAGSTSSWPRSPWPPRFRGARKASVSDGAALRDLARPVVFAEITWAKLVGRLSAWSGRSHRRYGSRSCSRSSGWRAAPWSSF